MIRNRLPSTLTQNRCHLSFETACTICDDFLEKMRALNTTDLNEVDEYHNIHCMGSKLCLVVHLKCSVDVQNTLRFSQLQH